MQKLVTGDQKAWCQGVFKDAEETREEGQLSRMYPSCSDRQEGNTRRTVPSLSKTGAAA